MFKTLHDAWKIKDLRKKMLWTLFLLIVFRAGAFITAPGVDGAAIATVMSQSTNGILNTLNIITGSAFHSLQFLQCLLDLTLPHQSLFSF